MNDKYVMPVGPFPLGKTGTWPADSGAQAEAMKYRCAVLNKPFPAAKIRTWPPGAGPMLRELKIKLDEVKTEGWVEGFRLGLIAGVVIGAVAAFTLSYLITVWR